MERMKRAGFATFAGLAALLSHALAAWLCGLAMPGYSHREHPLALLGAVGVPHPAWFNVFGFVLPGVLAAMAMWRFRSGMAADARWPLRIAAQLGVLGALAFAAQGCVPLDPGDIGAPTNALHALAWTLWWLSTSACAALLVRAANTRALRLAACAVVLLVPFLALMHWAGAMAAIAPRASYLLWLGWIACWPRLSRGAA